MKIFDFNIHPCCLENDTIDLIEFEKNLNILDFKKIFLKNRSNYKTNFLDCNFMILNTDFFKKKQNLNKIVNSDFKKTLFTALIDYNIENIGQYIENVSDSKIDGIKFHSYIQRIEEKHFNKIVDICIKIENKIKFICIDTSYGSLGLYKYDNLKLAIKILEKIKKIPVILLHSGGSRIIDAMHIAMDTPNVFLETSFSLPFYMNSNIEKDMAFVYKKIGCERVLYGSDFPYVSFKESISQTKEFFNKYDFSDKNIENIFYNNVQRNFF